VRHHRTAAAITDQHQNLDCCFPLRQFALGFWQLDDLLRGVAERNERFPARQLSPNYKGMGGADTPEKRGA
jgi:hypothetical protein